MTDHIAIHTERLTKHYGDVHALVDLDLEVRVGEVFGFLGPQRCRQDDHDSDRSR